MNKLVEDKQNSWKIFDKISGKYDLINRVLSFGNDRTWRNKLVEHLPLKSDLSILDVATGSGDQIIAFLKSYKVKKLTGIDLSNEMLLVAKEKLKSTKNVVFEMASAEEVPYPSESFDVVSCSFGIRNVSDVEKSISEMHRVLTVGGRVMILEFGIPENSLVKFFHLTYLRHILPVVGGLLSKNFAAYSYLNKTIESFPSGEKFCDIMRKFPFETVKAYSLNFGSVMLYIGEK